MVKMSKMFLTMYDLEDHINSMIVIHDEDKGGKIYTALNSNVYYGIDVEICERMLEGEIRDNVAKRRSTLD